MFFLFWDIRVKNYLFMFHSTQTVQFFHLKECSFTAGERNIERKRWRSGDWKCSQENPQLHNYGQDKHVESDSALFTKDFSTLLLPNQTQTPRENVSFENNYQIKRYFLGLGWGFVQTFCHVYHKNVEFKPFFNVCWMLESSQWLKYTSWKGRYVLIKNKVFYEQSKHDTLKPLDSKFF